MQLFRTALAVGLLATMHTAYGGEARNTPVGGKGVSTLDLAQDKQMAEMKMVYRSRQEAEDQGVKKFPWSRKRL